MAKIDNTNLVVGLDIGTNKIKAVVGEMLENDYVSIVGVGTYSAKGMDKGGVNDLNLVTQSIQRAINEMELMANYKATSVLMAITGRHVQCQNETGMVAINHPEVEQEDIDNVIHTARSVAIPAERRMLHVLPQEYSVDVQEGVKNPIGMSGVRMNANIHIITCAEDMAKNFIKCTDRADITVDTMVFSALAASYSVLTDDERELGVCVVDIGAGTIDLVIYSNGAIRHSAVIPVAGNQITGDIAKIFRTPVNNAEALKVRHACALKDMVSMEDTINVPSVGGRPARTMSRHTLAEVIEPRYQELFELIHEEIKSSGLEEQIAAGIVLTGGTVKMEGAVEFAEEIFQMPVRVGTPNKIKGFSDYVNDPSFAVAVGLLQYGRQSMEEQQISQKIPTESVLSRIKAWFKGEF